MTADFSIGRWAAVIVVAMLTGMGCGGSEPIAQPLVEATAEPTREPTPTSAPTVDSSTPVPATPTSVPEVPTAVPETPPDVVEEPTPDGSTGPPTEPSAEAGNDVQPTPTAVRSNETIPVVDETETGDDVIPGVVNAPIPEWTDSLEGTDDDAVQLRGQLLEIEDPSETVLLYRSLVAFRLGDQPDDDELEALKLLADPEGDRSDWQPGYVDLVDTATVLAANENLIELSPVQIEFIDPDHVLIFEALDLDFAFLINELLVPDLLDPQLLDPELLETLPQGE